MLTELGLGRLSFIEFQMPTLVDKPPKGRGWTHEIKYDGYRTQLIIQEGRVQAFTRNGYDWTDRYGPIVRAAAQLKTTERAIVDGEATVFGTTGRPDFQALRRELGKAESTNLIFHAFDLLHLDGNDLRDVPLLERKRTLQRLLKGAPPALIYVDHLEGDGPTVFEHACEMGLEGIVSKRADSPYRSGRQDSWLKLKCIKSDNFPIVAFVEKLGARPRRIASLYLGRRDGNRVHYAGKAQSGYSLTDAREVRERLDPLIVDKSPLAEPIDKPKATWVQPAVEAEIQYSGTTDDGLLREAVFKGLRDDLSPPAGASLVCKKPPSNESSGVPRENILQLLPDAMVPSKEELIRYWKKVAKKALVHLGRRPLKLVRHSHGITFYHKGRLPDIPDTVHQLRVQKREGGEGVRLWVDDLDGLLGLVEIGAVELHPWNTTVDDIEHADRVVIDLDPGEGIEWEMIVETALKVRDMLRSEGLDSWPKVTGGKGLHVMAPLQAVITHDDARQYARKLAQQLVSKHPDRYLLSAAPSARCGRIFLDYLRNGRGNTAVGAYSPRARSSFPIAAPVTWTQVEKGILPDAFTLESPFRPAKAAWAMRKNR
ncbi:DNA ligase D [Mesorhizobium sp. M0045]|uniref:DNA ligase D n=1 Tax=unclassified Mesorhizobium TaxID=325217 RepID=UPI00333D51EA